MEIKNAAIIGLGALGILYGSMISEHIGRDSLRIIADKSRQERYRKEGIYCNGRLCDFNYVSPEDKASPSDLVIFAVKYGGLESAIEDAKNHIGKDTVIISLLNGITSEEIIARTYGEKNILLCVAQGMDATRQGNTLVYTSAGNLFFGDRQKGIISEKTKALSRFFELAHIPHAVETDMEKRMWGKFMLNVGVNQAVTLFKGDYGTMQGSGKPRETMIGAMREVIEIAKHANISITEDDLSYWVSIVDGMNLRGKPSMRQDAEAGRITEVGLFSGAVIELAKKYNISVPVNEMLYAEITAMEKEYTNTAKGNRN